MFQDVIQVTQEEFAKLPEEKKEELRRVGKMLVNLGILASFSALPGLNFAKVGLFTAIIELVAIKAELRKMNKDTVDE